MGIPKMKVGSLGVTVMDFKLSHEWGGMNTGFATSWQGDMQPNLSELQLSVY